MFSNISKEALVVGAGVAGIALGGVGTYMYTKGKMKARVKDLELEVAQFNAKVAGGLSAAAIDGHGTAEAAELARQLDEERRNRAEKEASLKSSLKAQETVNKTLYTSNEGLAKENAELKERVVDLNDTIEKLHAANLDGTAWGMFRALMRISKTDSKGNMFTNMPKNWNGQEYITDMEEVRKLTQFKEPGIYGVLIEGKRRGVFIVSPSGEVALMYERYNTTQRSSTVIMYDTIINDSTAGHVTDTFFENLAQLLPGITL